MSLDTYLASRTDRCACGYHESQGCHCPGSEWEIFLTAIRTAELGGLVHQSDVRPLIRGRINPNSIGACYRRARTECLLVEVDHERSDDVLGRNSHRLEPVYRLAGAS